MGAAGPSISGQLVSVPGVLVDPEELQRSAEGERGVALSQEGATQVPDGDQVAPRRDGDALSILPGAGGRDDAMARILRIERREAHHRHGRVGRGDEVAILRAVPAEVRGEEVAPAGRERAGVRERADLDGIHEGAHADRAVASDHLVERDKVRADDGDADHRAVRGDGDAGRLSAGGGQADEGRLADARERCAVGAEELHDPVGAVEDDGEGPVGADRHAGCAGAHVHRGGDPGPARRRRAVDERQPTARREVFPRDGVAPRARRGEHEREAALPVDGEVSRRADRRFDTRTLPNRCAARDRRALAVAGR